MTNINLSQSSQEFGGGQKKAKASDKGLIISISILVVTLLIFGGLKLWSTQISSKQAQINDQIERESRSLQGKDVDRVADFQQRMLAIGDNISSKQDPNEILLNISNALVGGSVVNSIKADSGSVEIGVVSDNFLTVAKQVLSLKKSEYFSSVSITEVNTDESGKVSYTLSFTY